MCCEQCPNPEQIKLQQSSVFSLERHINVLSEKLNGKDPLGDLGIFVHLLIYLYNFLISSSHDSVESQHDW
jgi:hypothetical protein